MVRFQPDFIRGKIARIMHRDKPNAVSGATVPDDYICISIAAYTARSIPDEIRRIYKTSVGKGFVDALQLTSIPSFYFKAVKGDPC